MPLNNSSHDLLAQRRLTKVHGEHVTLYPVIVCSCKRSDDAHPDPTCRVCGGSGRAYARSTFAKGLIASVSSRDKSLLAAGIAMPGDLTFSPDLSARLAIHDYDMIRLRYGLPHEGEVVERGKDRLAYIAERITDVEQHDPVTGGRVRYTEGIDFVWAGRSIVWVDLHGPALGTVYSVKYYAVFDWVVYPGVTIPRIVRGQLLGQRVLLRKRHLIGIPVVLSETDPTPAGLTDPTILLDSDGDIIQG